MVTLYKEDEISGLEKRTGGAVLSRTEDISFVMTSLEAMLRQVGLGQYIKLKGEDYRGDFSITIEINEAISNEGEM